MRKPFRSWAESVPPIRSVLNAAGRFAAIVSVTQYSYYRQSSRNALQGEFAERAELAERFGRAVVGNDVMVI
jgi:hypothetical protein